MHEHSEGHARQSFHVFGTKLFKYSGGGVGGGDIQEEQNRS